MKVYIPKTIYVSQLNQFFDIGIYNVEDKVGILLLELGVAEEIEEQPVEDKIENTQLKKSKIKKK